MTWNQCLAAIVQVGKRMSKRSLFFAALVCFMLHTIETHAQVKLERFVKKNNEVVTGEFIRVTSDMKYSIRVGNHTIEIPVADIRTIEPMGAEKQTHYTSANPNGQKHLNEVLAHLAQRSMPQIAPQHIGLFKDALANVHSNQWDKAIDKLGRLLSVDDGWAEPQLLRALLLSHRGDSDEALRVAARIENNFQKDKLAQKIAAQVYLQAGFPLRSACTLQRMYRMSGLGDQLPYELAHMWWPIDPSRSIEYWNEYKTLDPQLRKPWCQEGELIRNAKMALSVEDWSGAHMAIDELLQKYPWVSSEARPLRITALQERQKSAESSGRFEEALIACQTLIELDPDQASHWIAQSASIQSFLLTQATTLNRYEDLKRWCLSYQHLFAKENQEWQQRISAKYQMLALIALANSELDISGQAFMAASKWDKNARPQDLWKLIEACLNRIRGDLRVGRKRKVLQQLSQLRDAYPEHRQKLLESLQQIYRSVLQSSLAHEDFKVMMVELSAVMESRELSSSMNGGGTESKFTTVEPNQLHSIASVKEIERYYPLRVGTRWVYLRGDGKREIREVISLVGEEEGLKATIKVSGDSIGQSFSTHVYVRESRLILHRSVAPPGEIALQFPFVNGASWNWRKDSFNYERTIHRASEYLQLPVGSFSDYIRVESVNSFPSVDTNSTYSSKVDIYYVAGVGLAKIEASDPSLSKTLIEFRPAPSLHSKLLKSKENVGAGYDIKPSASKEKEANQK